ncbi:MAG: tetratricopeptide repeat protein [Bacteroidales bacterium]|nr:tetratricopeptide repeat protein [Bacteroidales bacterium]
MNRIYLYLFALLPMMAFAQSAEQVLSTDSLLVSTGEGDAVALLEDAVEGASKQAADSAYVAGDYHTAIRQYESLLQGGVNAEVYYNLGNSYFKVDDIARAILNYERALLMSPGNGDIRANLEIARAKTVDKVVPQPELFFVNWYLSLRAVMSVDGWATVGILTFLIFLIGMGLYFFVSAIQLRKVGFYVAVVSVCLCLLSNLFAYQQKEIMQRHDKAIILVPSVTVRSTPSESGTGLFILHEGHKVSIKDDSMREWREIVIEDGKVGWVRLADIGII